MLKIAICDDDDAELNQAYSSVKNIAETESNWMQPCRNFAMGLAYLIQL